MKKLKEVTDELYQDLEGDEKALVDAMLGVVNEYGKFGSETSNVFINYLSPEENEDKDIGVKCGNCVFHYEVANGIACSAVAVEIEDEGLCRLSMIPPGLVSTPESLTEAMTYSPPEGVRAAARRALKWIADGKAGDGFTAVGRRRASQLASGKAVSRDTVARMKSYFARHEVDKKAKGFNAGETGYPSAGRVAWDAWGGNAGKSWVNGINLETKEAEEAVKRRKRKKKSY